MRVHGHEIQEVEEDDYLGDVVNSNGKNTSNIQKRVAKGIGIKVQINNILEMLNFGKHFLDIALLLRNSVFINGICYNMEVWYNLQKKEIEELEKLDRNLLHGWMGLPSTVAKEAIFLELGIHPLGSILKGRRINYFYYLATRDHDSLLYKFFHTQWIDPTKGDLVLQMKRDLEDLELTMEPEDACKMT